MPRVIRWYNKDNEREAGYMELPDISLSEFKIIYPTAGGEASNVGDYIPPPKFLEGFPDAKKVVPKTPDQTSDPLLYGCYEIAEKQVAFFKEHIDFKFEFDKYDYFLEYDADEK